MECGMRTRPRARLLPLPVLAMAREAGEADQVPGQVFGNTPLRVRLRADNLPAREQAIKELEKSIDGLHPGKGDGS
jgi:hypothetical protein